MSDGIQSTHWSDKYFGFVTEVYESDGTHTIYDGNKKVLETSKWNGSSYSSNTTPLQATKLSAGVTEAQKSSSGSATVSSGLFTAYQITDEQAQAMGYSSAQEYANKFSSNETLGDYASSFFGEAGNMVSGAIDSITSGFGSSFSGLTGSVGSILGNISGSMSSILGTASGVAGIVNTASNMIGSVAGSLADILGQGTSIELNTDEDFQKLYSASGLSYSFGTGRVGETGMAGSACFTVTEFMPVKQNFMNTIGSSVDTTSASADGIANIANRVSTLLNKNKTNKQKRYKIVVTNSGTESTKHLQALLDEKLEEQKKKQAEYEKIMKELNEKRSKYEIEKLEYDIKSADAKREKNNDSDTTYWDATETQKASQSEKTKRSFTSQSKFSNKSTEYQQNIFNHPETSLEMSTLAETIQKQNQIEPTCEDVGKVIDVDAELEYYRLKYKIELRYKDGYLTKEEFDVALAKLYEEWYGEGGKVYRKKAVCSPFIASANAVLKGTSTVSDNLTPITEMNNDAETLREEESENYDGTLDTLSADTVESTTTSDTQEENLQTMLDEIESLEKMANESQLSIGTLTSQISQLKSTIAKNTTVTTKREEIEDKNGLLDALAKVEDISQIVSTVTSASAVNSVTGMISNLSQNLSTPNIINSLKTVSAIASGTKVGNIANKISSTVAGVSNISNAVKSGISSITNQIGGLVSATNKATEKSKSSITSAVGGVCASFGGVSAPDAPAPEKSKSTPTKESDKDAKKVVSGTEQAKKAIADAVGGKKQEDADAKSEESKGSNDKTETAGGQTQKQLSSAYKPNMSDALQNMNPVKKVTMAFELPLPDQIGDTYQANWDFERADGMMAKLVSNAKQGGIGNVVGGLAVEVGKSALSWGVNAMKDYAKKIPVIGDALSDKISEDDIKKAMSYASRTAENPKLMAMFKHIEPRVFTLSWTLIPRSKEEADQIFNLVKDLKYKCLPSETGMGAMVSYPAFVTMKFSHSGTALDRYPYAKSCAVTKIETTYSKEVMEDGSPMKIVLTMELKETLYLTQQTFKENTGWSEPNDEITIRKNAILANAEEEQRIAKETQTAAQKLLKAKQQAEVAATQQADGAKTATTGGSNASLSAKNEKPAETAQGNAKGSTDTAGNNNDASKKTAKKG